MSQTKPNQTKPTELKIDPIDSHLFKKWGQSLTYSVEKMVKEEARGKWPVRASLLESMASY